MESISGFNLTEAIFLNMLNCARPPCRAASYRFRLPYHTSFRKGGATLGTQRPFYISQITVFKDTKPNCCKNISIQMLLCFVNAFNSSQHGSCLPSSLACVFLSATEFIAPAPEPGSWVLLLPSPPVSQRCTPANLTSPKHPAECCVRLSNTVWQPSLSTARNSHVPCYS